MWVTPQNHNLPHLLFLSLWGRDSCLWAECEWAESWRSGRCKVESWDSGQPGPQCKIWQWLWHLELRPHGTVGNWHFSDIQVNLVSWTRLRKVKWSWATSAFVPSRTRIRTKIRTQISSLLDSFPLPKPSISRYWSLEDQSRAQQPGCINLFWHHLGVGKGKRYIKHFCFLDGSFLTSKMSVLLYRTSKAPSGPNPPREI